ncbi:efflux RND transporter periplasmic adaptor subunit [Salinisphaera sp. Q1T1-3]|uniref:efflux RND transporter periplasmic adaptor subunit n=1 Tax=Salinisphaera sp. Q1T1-3 TaxID=2321229 RepID=UPI001314403E|nr:efflux RND transporter periplasmic adaptor subunit [Salinisphaera sp. Q1T1-3]
MRVSMNCLSALLLISLAGAQTGCNPETTPGQTDPEPQRTAKTEDEHGAGEDHAHHDAHEASSRRLTLTSAQRERLPIETGPAEAGTAEATLSAPAEVRFDADRVAHIGPRVEAKVVSVTADLGDTVAPGDTLAVLDSVALGRAKAAWLRSNAETRNARAVYRRKQQLAEDRIVSATDVDAAQVAYVSARAERRAARAELVLHGLTDTDIAAIDAGDDSRLSRFSLISPIAGTVQRRDLVAGQTVSSDATPVHVVDADTLWVMMQISADQAPRVRPGQAMSFTVRALPNRQFDGRIDWVSQALDNESRTLAARAVVNNQQGRLAAGMFGQARIQAAGGSPRALVPVDAVQVLDDDRPVVFVPGDAPGHFRAVAVATGAETAGLVEIVRGISPGETVVRRGAFDLKSILTSGTRSAAHSH